MFIQAKNLVRSWQHWWQDRELQLYDGTRLLAEDKFEDLKAAEGCTDDQLEARGIRKIHSAFRNGNSLR
jgi:hypothetical protein